MSTTFSFSFMLKMPKSSSITKFITRGVCILFFMVTSFVCFGQYYELRGKIIDETGRPVRYASVTLTKFPDSTIIDGCAADSLGEFRFRQIDRKCMLEVKAIGYQTIRRKIDLNSNLDIGSLILSIDAFAMKEVSVFASKPTVRREIDRLTFDVSNTVSSHGANALELLQEVPGLRVDNNNIKVIGKGELKVFINDRESKLSGDALIALLKSYSANEVNKVEVMTTPPARYEAAGNTGIVNIVMKKKPQNYFGGSTSATEYYQNYKSVDAANTNINGNLNLNKEKITSSLGVNYANGKTGYMENNNVYYPGQTWDNRNVARNPREAFSLSGSVDYALNDKYTVGVQSDYIRTSGNTKEDYRSEIKGTYSSLLDSLILSLANRDRTDRRNNINLHVDRRIDTVGKKVLFDIDYLYNSAQTDEVFLSDTYNGNQQVIEGTRYGYDRDQSNHLNAFSSSLDFLLPYQSFSITAGLKYSYIKNDYFMHYYNDTDIDEMIDKFEYREQIAAVYFDFTKEVSSQIKLKAGLRLENTSTEGYSRSKDQQNNNDYVRLFPSVFFSWQPGKSHVVNLSFSNRISRPYYNMVNPFRTYVNRYTYVEGKSDLAPYYTYNSEVGYTYEGNLNISAFYSFADDTFDQSVTLDSETKITGLSWDNFVNKRTFGVTNSYSFDELKWIRIYFQQGVNYSENKSLYPTNPGVKGWGYYAELRNNIYFNSQKTFTGSLSGSYTSRQYLSNVTLRPNIQINAGLRYNFLNNKMTTSFNVTNLFNFSASRGETISNDIVMRIKNYYSPGTFRLSFSYNFGATLATKSRNYSNADIQRRL